MAENAQKRTDILNRWSQMKTERSTWWSHWQELTQYILPRNGRYFRSDRDRGQRRHNNIYDSTGSRALRTLGAGLMAGATSPARPWFRLNCSNPDLNRYMPVKLWLEDVTDRMQTVFQKSNTYRALHQMYEELGCFGTSCSVVLPDFNSVIHHYPVTIGEFCIATNWQGQVTSMYREFEKTCGEIVKEFGIDKCSPACQSMYRSGQLDKWIAIIHAIEPRYDRDPSKKDAKNMQWSSIYFEIGSGVNDFLHESGFKQFPVLAPRWAVAGGDIYGNSPGMEALGDIKQLQHEQLRKSQAIDYQSNPPLVLPLNLKGRDVDRLPGGLTFTDITAGTVKSMFEVNLELQYLLQDLAEVRQRINQSFFADLFMMLANATDTRMTATEVAMRQEEKMLMLGPVLERLNNELLQPLIEMTFTQMSAGGAIPPAPQEMSGTELTVEFVSMLAQAQRAIGTNSMDRFVAQIGAIAQMKPDVLDKFNSDKWADLYPDMLGVSPQIIMSDDQVQQLRDARAKAQAAQQQAQMQQQQSQTTKNLAQSPTNKAQPNALQDIMNQFSGYGSPSPQQIPSGAQ